MLDENILERGDQYQDNCQTIERLDQLQMRLYDNRSNKVHDKASYLRQCYSNATHIEIASLARLGQVRVQVCFFSVIWNTYTSSSDK